MTDKYKLMIISNRLPVVFKKENDDWTITPGKGGLVTAMAPVLKNRGGLWMGWTGTTDEDNISKDKMDSLIQKSIKDSGFELCPIMLTEREKEKFYEGFSNEIIWPLFHDLPSICNFSPEYWEVYKDVNIKFANAISERISHNTFIWVHDYHLMNVGRKLRQKNIKNNIGFFLHIPFPPLDIFAKIPWRKEILEALLNFDLLGFQTPRDKRNFIQCVKTFYKGQYKIRGKGNIRTISFNHRDTRVGSFPISIDYRSFEEGAQSQEVADRAWYLHENLKDTQIVLGVDRLDYTKGIPFKLQAFRRALIKYPEMVRKVSLIQILVPSRTHIPQYKKLKENIEKLVGEINGQFTELGWIPIYYIFKNNSREELLAYYRTAETVLVTPLKDGMNLVAKEFCACSVDHNSVLILSEFAGASAQLSKNSLSVNPYDIEKMADAIYRSFKMDFEERKKRMVKLRKSIRDYDIFWWVDAFLKEAIYQSADEFAPVKEFDFEYKL